MNHVIFRQLIATFSAVQNLLRTPLSERKTKLQLVALKEALKVEDVCDSPCESRLELASAVDVLNPDARRCRCVVGISQLKENLSLPALTLMLKKLTQFSGDISLPAFAWQVESDDGMGAHSLQAFFALEVQKLILRNAEDKTDPFKLLFVVQGSQVSSQHFSITFDEVYNAFSHVSRNDGRREFLKRLETALASKTVLLFMGESIFRIKSGANSELVAFEEFLNFLSAQNCGLVVSSRQELVNTSQQKSILNVDYGVDTRTSYRDSQQRLRFTSVKSSERGNLALAQILKQGAFDRLLELLSQGQGLLDSLATRARFKERE